MGRPLNGVLQEMLAEDPKHRTERRGSGYTQATRHLAKHVNTLRDHDFYDEIRLFADRDSTRLRALIGGAAQAGVPFQWRSLDLQPPPPAMAARPDWVTLYEAEAAQQGAIRALPGRLEREESAVLARMIRDLLLPPGREPSAPTLTPWPVDLEVGTCPLAEKYVLELLAGFVRRGGRMNVIVSADETPLMIEKLNIGDDHSCVSLVPLRLNDVLLPPGSLLSVTYEGDVAVRENRDIAGAVIPVARCGGFRFLRLTTLAISPANRERAFTSHYKAQVDGGLFSPGTATVERLRARALEQL